MEELTDRRQVVLGLVVCQYIATATPVGSNTIVEQYGLDVSSATIRNEMGYLEEQVRLNPKNPRYHLELGQEYARQNRNEEALRVLQRALEIDPNFAAAEVAITDLLAKRSR